MIFFYRITKMLMKDDKLVRSRTYSVNKQFLPTELFCTISVYGNDNVKWQTGKRSKKNLVTRT